MSVISDFFNKFADNIKVSLPFGVWHPEERGGGKPWNEGWGNNPGAIVEVTKDVAELEDGTTVYAGLTGGSYKNSIFEQSNLGGITVGVEKDINKYGTNVSAGILAGGVSGYGDDIKPAVALKAGLGQKFNLFGLGEYNVSLDLTCLPSNTIPAMIAKYVAGVDVGVSDAFSVGLTFGKA